MIEINIEYLEIKHGYDLYDLISDESRNREYPLLGRKWNKIKY